MEKGIKIAKLTVKNFVGIDVLEFSPSGINVFEGPKASGKTSILEAIETAVTNNRRRSEVIRLGQDEATIFVEFDNGLAVDRRIRNEKADYLKLRKDGEGIKSNESELRKLLSGDIFRPLDFINLDSKKQTEIILNMIPMVYTPEEINAWFGEDVLSNINTEKHLLQILKDIEVKRYDERQEINRQIKTLESQVQGIKSTLPRNYDGEEWKTKKVQDYYNKVSEAQRQNGLIKEAISLKDGLQTQIDAINSEKQSQISQLELRYKNTESDIKDLIELQNSKIQKSSSIIDGVTEKVTNTVKKLENDMTAEIAAIKKKYEDAIKQKTEEIQQEAKNQEEIIQDCKQKIAAKDQELLSLSDKKQVEIESIENTTAEKIKTAKARVGKAVEYIENNAEIDIEPLQKEADYVAEMQSYMRDWDRMLEIQNGTLAEKNKYSAHLTNIIEIARNKPTELLQQHKLPIDGISVDEKGLIRINGTLLDGLSEGEKLEAAFKIALQRIGQFRFICLDGFEKLNKSEQEKILRLCVDNDLQVFITVTTDTENGEMKIKEEI